MTDIFARVARRAMFLGGAFAMSLAVTGVAQAQVKVMISGGFSGSYEKLVPVFEQSTGIKVETSSGASQGDGPETVKAQIAGGRKVDIVILSREGLDELVALKHIAAGTDVDLARTPIGVGVHAGAPKPDASTIEAFKKMVTSAKSVAMPASTAGIWLTQNIFPKLGIADKVNVKMSPRGSGATAMVASGEAEIAVMPVSEIVHAKGVDLAGIIPEEIQLNQVFCAAIVAGASDVADAKKLIDFLTSSAAAGAIKASGMEPLGRK